MVKITKSRKTEKEGVMKKLIVVGLVAMLAIFAGSVAQAQMDTAQNVQVLVGVTAVFGFDIWETEHVQSDTVVPGVAGMGDVHIGATSNHTIPWKIMASSAGAIGQNHGVVLPIKMTTGIAGTEAGTKVTDLVLTSSAQAIYTAAASEYPKTGVQVGAMYVVPTSDGYVTPLTPQDLYVGNIVLTMTE